MVKKTMHELAKEFPEKTYKELEKYRDADRQEEAQQIFTQQENEELRDDQYKEINSYLYWKNKYEKEHKLRQEVETELKKDRSYPDLTEVLAVENDKLKKEIIQLGKDNRKLSKQIEDGIDRMRKAGVI